MRTILTLFAICLPLLAWGAENMPAHCKPVSIPADRFEPGTKEPALLFIRNRSPSDLWITHPVTDPGASAGFSSRLLAGHWSALALDREKFALSCIESIPGHEQQIPCAGVIDACLMEKVTFPEKLRGTFWAGEDMPLDTLRDHIGSRGIQLPANAQ